MTELAIPINEATRRVGVGRTALYEAVGRGELRLRKVGRKSLIVLTDLEAWVNSWPDGDLPKARAKAVAA